MKNIINFKSILVYTILITGTSFLVSSCSENKNVDTRGMAEQENMSKLGADHNDIVVIENNNDSIFLIEAAEMHLEQINLGKLAQERGNSTHVKELGKMMEKDYTKSYTELKSLAQSKSISLPNTTTEDSRDVHQNLLGENGNEFGIAYSDMMVEKHEDAIKLFEKVSTESEDPKIRTWAYGKLSELRTHLEHAQTSKTESDKRL